VSVIDVVAVATKFSSKVASNYAQRFAQEYPDVSQEWCNFKFPGQGQRETPVTGARGAVELVMLLPGKAAARVRKAAAQTLVRYLGGDMSLVEEIAANRFAQETMDDDDPMRIFGSTVETEAVRRKREEVELAELDSRLKRARVEVVHAATDMARLAIGALADLALPVTDRDRMMAKDLITTATFTALPESATDNEICLQSFCIQHGRSAQLASRLGKEAKALYLRENPGYCFQKKTIFANGQLVPANVWRESMRSWLERTLESMAQS